MSLVHDLVVIGGSYAGMSAALQLIRARRKVVIIDEGLRRNRYASKSHGLVGSDGMSPNHIAKTAKDQLLQYPTLTWVQGRALSVEGAKDEFKIVTADKQEFHGRRVLMACGITDNLPQIEGVQERWGKSLFHCPYCHGYELNQGEVAVLATSPMSLHQGQLLPEWGTVTFFTNGVTFEPEALKGLEAKNVKIVNGVVKKLEGEADVVLEDGAKYSFAGVFTAPTVSPSAEQIVKQLNCDLLTNPLGSIIKVNNMKESSVPGVYACGDVGVFPSTVALAIGDGALAGLCIHRSLLTL